ncbi:hypothetical protein [Tsuneonella sp. SYSU-LHT278]|uniref:hypothetical protein n=1 Tax=Tsuneonella sediminis TaxID=3416089 RepID=UPI003F79108A
MDDDLLELLKERFRPERMRYFVMCLRHAASAKAAFDDADAMGPARAEAARRLLETLLNGIGGLVGDRVLSAAYGTTPPPTAPRDQHLAALWFRLWPAQALFATVEDQRAMSSVQSLRDEVLAVSNGDDPSLLARVISSAQGVGGSRYRIANKKLRALEWIEFLEGRGLPPAEAQARVSMAFGNTPWTTIRGWRAQCDNLLGGDVVTYMLAVARSGWHGHFLGLVEEKVALAQLAIDGEEFMQSRVTAKAGPRRRPHRKEQLPR